MRNSVLDLGNTPMCMFHSLYILAWAINKNKQTVWFGNKQSSYLSRISRFISVEKKLSCGEISLDHFFRTLTEIRPAVFKRGVSALLAIHLLVNFKFYVCSESNQQKLIAKYRSCSRHKFKRHICIYYIYRFFYRF